MSIGHPNDAEQEDYEMDMWRTLDQFPRYSISRDGRIHSSATGRVLRPQTNSGYHTVTLCHDGVQVLIGVHRLICEAFHGPAPQKGMTPNHKDLNRHNNHADNLEWLTQSDNVKHAYANGARTINDAHKARCAALGRAKRSTTTDQEQAIQAAFTGKRGDIERLAAQFDTSRDVIRRILGR